MPARHYGTLERRAGTLARGRSTGKKDVDLAVRLFYFPALCLFLELVLHIYMKTNLRYWPIFLLFGLSFGFLASAVLCALRGRAARCFGVAFSFLLSLVFIGEMIARIILQTYYAFSILGVAAKNKLSDYAPVIFATIWGNLPIILVMLAPPAVFTAYVRGRACERMKSGIAFSGVLFAVLHLFSLGLVNWVDWKADMGPKYLYHTDTDLNDQVEALGLISMLRLDLKHSIVPVRRGASEFVAVDLPGTGSAAGSAGSDAPGASSAAGEDAPETVSAAQEGERDGETRGVGRKIDRVVIPVDTSPNVMNIDLEKLAEDTDDEDVEWLANYFNSLTPTNKNKYTGLFKGYNVIFLSLEGFSGYGVSRELTPTLYKMMTEGFVFNNYYTALHYTSTSNGECQHLLGLYPKSGDPITMSRTGTLGTNTYFSLARQLNRLGYASYGYHNNGDLYNRYESHTNLGYDYEDAETGLPREENDSGDLRWPQRDTFMADVTTGDYMNSDTPFNVYYMTISGHTPYSWNWVASQYEDILDEKTAYSEHTKAYLATCMEVDHMLALLIQRLEEAGKLENTVIVASPDHVPYFDIDVLEELAGERFGSSDAMSMIDESDINFEVYRSACFLWSASMKEPVPVDKVCCQVDLLPTLSNLLGLEYDSRMLDGSDALSENEGLVVFASRSWRSDRGFYNRFTQEFTPAPGVTMSEAEQDAYVEAMKTIVSYKLESTPMLIESDFYEQMQPYITKN